MVTPTELVLKQLSRKPVTDKEARRNFIEAITDYLHNLESLDVITVEQDSPVYEQKQFLLKLQTLASRYETIGNDIIPDDKLETFLKKVQDMCREYLHLNLEREIYELNRIHYTKLAFNTDNDTSPKSRLAAMKEQAAQVLRK